jgi:hypothetical protein
MASIKISFNMMVSSNPASIDFFDDFHFQPRYFSTVPAATVDKLRHGVQELPLDQASDELLRSGPRSLVCLSEPHL